MDDAGDQIAIALQRHGDGEMRNPVEKIGGAVQRIDDPTVPAVLGRDLAALLEHEAIVGARLLQFLAQQALGLDVGLADEIARPLARDLKLFDLAEIMGEAARRLLHGLLHHGDQGGLSGHDAGTFQRTSRSGARGRIPGARGRD